MHIINQFTGLSYSNSAWIFQANPKSYNLQKALQDEKVISEMHWAVNQYKNLIEKDHIGIIWQSGAEAGIYAITKILTNPDYFDETEAEKKYWTDGNEESGKILRVKMVVQCNLCNDPFYRDTIKTIPGLQNLSILKQPRGTNFRVNNDEWSILEDWVRSRKWQMH